MQYVDHMEHILGELNNILGQVQKVFFYITLEIKMNVTLTVIVSQELFSWSQGLALFKVS